MLWISPLSIIPLVSLGATVLAWFVLVFFSRQIGQLKSTNRLTILLAVAGIGYNIGAAITYSSVLQEQVLFYYSWQQICLMMQFSVYIFLLKSIGCRIPNWILYSTAAASAFFLLGHTLVPELVFAGGLRKVSVLDIWLRWEPNVTILSIVLYAYGISLVLICLPYIFKANNLKPEYRTIMIVGNIVFVLSFMIDGAIVVFAVPIPYTIEIGQLFLLGSIITALGRTTLAEYQETARFNVMRRRIMDNLSHELRTPIGVVRGYLDMLQKGYFGLLNPKQMQAVERAYESASRQIEQVDDLLLTALIEKSGIAPQWDWISLFPLISSISTDLEKRYSSTRTKLLLSFDKNVDIFGDPMLIKKMLNKILTNAIVYSPPGSSVCLNMYQELEDYVHITLDDNGPGIPDESIPLVTKPFAQLTDSSRIAKGIGLGLAIASEIIKVHSGTLSLENRPGGGLHLEIRLPLRKDNSDKGLINETTSQLS